MGLAPGQFFSANDSTRDFDSFCGAEPKGSTGGVFLGGVSFRVPGVFSGQDLGI